MQPKMSLQPHRIQRVKQKNTELKNEQAEERAALKKSTWQSIFGEKTPARDE